MGKLGTFGLAFAGMALALAIGILGAIARTSNRRIVRAPVIAFVEVVRNTPCLVQIFYIYFALPLMGIRFSPTTTAIIALGINGDHILRGLADCNPTLRHL